jgi:predicted membrane protein
MTAGKWIANIAAAILILFGILFVLAAFSEAGTIGNILVGIILLVVGFVIILLTGRKAKKEKEAVQITQQIELSGDVNLETMTCKSCGGTLSSEHITMLAGAPVVNCPYCGSSYQLTEEPKW